MKLEKGMKIEDALKVIEKDYADDDCVVYVPETEEEYGILEVYWGEWEIRNGKLY